MSGEVKVCATCLECKPTTHFYVKRKVPNLTYRSDCKSCYSIKAAEVFRKPEPTEARKQSWRKHSRFKLYGITEGQYDLMLEMQGGLCKICEDVMVKPCIDHCHKTGMVRGLLCNGCNVGLGNFRDSPERMAKAIEYLRL